MRIASQTMSARSLARLFALAAVLLLALGLLRGAWWPVLGGVSAAAAAAWLATEEEEP